jgi:hypothetical protein
MGFYFIFPGKSSVSQTLKVNGCQTHREQHEQRIPGQQYPSTKSHPERYQPKKIRPSHDGKDAN